MTQQLDTGFRHAAHDAVECFGVGRAPATKALVEAGFPGPAQAPRSTPSPGRLAGLPPGASPTAASRHGDRDRLRRWSLIVAQAKALIDQLPAGEAPPVQEIARRVGVSERTLRGAFVGVLGVGPARHLRAMRLMRVRSLLLAAPHRPSVVKQAAMSLSFFHLGHFSGAYRAEFGELPSETVARGRRMLGHG